MRVVGSSQLLIALLDVLMDVCKTTNEANSACVKYERGALL